MLPFLNIHTHCPDSRDDVLAVLCCEPVSFSSDRPPSACYSVGIHPWRVGVQSRAHLSAMATLLQSGEVVAVGEIGLDKVCDADFNLQQQIFSLQLRMAACVQKPVVVHCVKAWNELLEMLSSVENLPPVIIHGFRGKPQLAEQLCRHGCFLSFGPKFNVETLKSMPLGAFFLETDDSASDIVELYTNVAALKNVRLDELKQIIADTWCRLFGLPIAACLPDR